MRKFPLTNLWEGAPCGRKHCTTCLQGGERLPSCTKRSLLYENICTICHPKAKEGKEIEVTSSSAFPSIYVGESSRSLYERGKEHWKAYEKRLEGSHILKHHVLHHNGEGRPEFHLRPVQYFRTALSRQAAEAVRIYLRGGEGNLLNSKTEFNRCQVTRLSLPKEEEGRPKQPQAEEGRQGEDGEEDWQLWQVIKHSGGSQQEAESKRKADNNTAIQEGKGRKQSTAF